MAVVVSITPEPTPWTIGQQGVYLLRFRDRALNTPVRLVGGTVTGKFGAVVIAPGGLALLDADNGLAVWTAVAADAPVVAGRYGIQFKITGTPGGVVECDPYGSDVKAAL